MSQITPVWSKIARHSVALMAVVLLSGCESPERTAFKHLMNQMKATQKQAYIVTQAYTDVSAREVMQTYSDTVRQIVSNTSGTSPSDVDIKARLAVVTALVERAKGPQHMDMVMFSETMKTVDAQCKSCHEKYN